MSTDREEAWGQGNGSWQGQLQAAEIWAGGERELLPSRSWEGDSGTTLLSLAVQMPSAEPTPWSPLPPSGVSAIKAMGSQAELNSLQVQPKEEKLPSAPLARVLRHFSILPSCPCFPWSYPRTLWQQGGFRCSACTDTAGPVMQLCPWEQSASVPSKLWGSGQCSVWGWGLSWLC